MRNLVKTYSQRFFTKNIRGSWDKFSVLGILLIFFMIGTAPSVQAQRKKFYKVGLQLGYNYGDAPSFQEAIQRFNLVRTDFTHASLRHGFYLGANASYGLSPQVYVYAQGSFRRLLSQAKNFGYEVETFINTYELVGGFQIYPFALNKRYSTGFAGSFYLSIYNGFAYVTPYVNQGDIAFSRTRSPRTPGGAITDPDDPLQTDITALDFSIEESRNFEDKIYTYVFGGGMGVDLYTANRFSFSPEIMVSYYTPFKTDGLTEFYTNSALIAGDDRGGILYIQAGLHLRYHSTPKGIRRRR